MNNMYISNILKGNINYLKAWLAHNLLKCLCIRNNFDLYPFGDIFYGLSKNV